MHVYHISKLNIWVVDLQTFRKSLLVKLSTILAPDEKNPRPRGLYATIPMPSSLNN